LYPIFLALRYARTRVVTYLALLTVAVSVASFVVVMGILGGFRHRVEKIIQETGAPLEIHCGATYGVFDPEGVARRLGRIPGVKGASPYIQSGTLIRTDNFRALGFFRGIDLKRELKYGRLREYLLARLPVEDVGKEMRGVPPPPRSATPAPPVSFKAPRHMRRHEVNKKILEPWLDPTRSEPGEVPVWFREKKPGRRPAPPGDEEDEEEGLIPRTQPMRPAVPPGVRPPQGVIVGAKRARNLGLRVGDEVIMAVLDPHKDTLARTRSFWVIGFYKSDTDWLNDIILIDRQAAEDLTGRKEASGISIWLDEPDQVLTVRERVRRAFQEDRYTKVRTWRESQPGIFNMMNMQDRVMLIILMIFFVMTGAFVMAILWVLVAEKTRDIGTIRALGAGRTGVVFTFVSQGLAISAIGVGAGLGLGHLLAANVNEVIAALDGLLLWAGLGEIFGSVSRSLFEMERLPVHYDPLHLWVMTGITVAVSFLASLAPALRAAWLDPVEALRRE
jgi:lipoprotein-releasing system permease protein